MRARAIGSKLIIQNQIAVAFDEEFMAVGAAGILQVYYLPG
jgi:hypothetical protein